MDVPNEPRRGLNRDALLKAASGLMRERDTIDLSLADIAGRARCNTALVSYHFGGKRGLFVALLERDLGIALGQLDGLLGMTMSPTKKMALHLGGIIRLFYDFPYLQRLVLHVMQDRGGAGAREIAERFLQPMIRAHHVLIEDGVRAGEFKPVDPQFFYFLVIGACDQIFSQRFVMRHVHGLEIDDATRRRYADQIRRTILTGLLA